MKKALIIVAALAVLGLVGFGVMRLVRGTGDAAATKPATAPTTPVKAGNQLTAEGRVVPVQWTTLSFAAGGVVTEVLVKEGETVRAGQVLARLESARQAAAVAQAEAELNRGEARLAELKAGPRPGDVAAARANLDGAQARLAKVRQGATAAELAAAEAEVHRAQARLAAEQGRSSPALAELEAARAAVIAARAQWDRLRQGPTAEDLAVAEAEVRRAQAQLDLTLAGTRSEAIATAEADLAAGRPGLAQARAALAETELRAPFTGTTAFLDVKPGQFVAPGAALVRLADLSAWQVETEDLTELGVARIADGTAATLTFDALPGLELPARVVRIRALGEKRQGDMTYTAVLQPERTDARLRWNMTAVVTLETR